jgi:hypothetical protein
MKFDPNANPPAIVSETNGGRLEKGEAVRIRIVGMRVDATEIVSFTKLRNACSITVCGLLKIIHWPYYDVRLTHVLLPLTSICLLNLDLVDVADLIF